MYIYNYIWNEPNEKNYRTYLASVQSTWTFAFKTKNTKNQYTQSRVFRKISLCNTLFILFSFFLSLSRFVSVAPANCSVCICIDIDYLCFFFSLSVSVFFQFDWHTNLGSATFLEPCSKFLENLKEVSSGVELKMVHVLTCLTMQFRWEVTATFLKWMRGTRQNHQNIIIINYIFIIKKC